MRNHPYSERFDRSKNGAKVIHTVKPINSLLRSKPKRMDIVKIF